jgi:hypothetical protein
MSGPENYIGNASQVVEMDGNFDNLQELVYIESALSSTKTTFYGELTHAMLALVDVPGSNNGTGLMQTLAAFAIRDLYEKKSAQAAKVKQAAAATVVSLNMSLVFRKGLSKMARDNQYTVFGDKMATSILLLLIKPAMVAARLVYGRVY